MLHFDMKLFNEKLSVGGVVVVDFWASWCGPCRMFAPIFEELENELKGKATLGKVDIDANMSLAQQYSVMSIPTIIIFKDGKEMARFIGLRTKAQLIAEIGKYV